MENFVKCYEEGIQKYFSLFLIYGRKGVIQKHIIVLVYVGHEEVNEQ